MIILMILILLIGIQWMRTSRDDARLHEYRYRFFALRDRLRRIAIEDGKMGRSWLFPYLDSTISNAIYMLPDMSAWQVLALTPWAHHQQDRISAIHSQLNRELTKPRNAPMRAVYEDMWMVIAQQFVSRHFVMSAALDGTSRLIEGARKVRAKLRKRERRSLESVLLDEPNRKRAPGSEMPGRALGMAAH
jgi:hypothetical protein